MKHQLLPTAASNAASTACTHMLLYLCEETFVGDAGRRLAHEIREANRLSLRIVMVHECDPDKNGNPSTTYSATHSTTNSTTNSGNPSTTNSTTNSATHSTTNSTTNSGGLCGPCCYHRVYSD